LTDAQSAKSQFNKDLIGTWVCVGTPGAVGEAPAIGGRLKSLTDARWALTEADPTTGATNYYHGGTWSLNGSEYKETVEYAGQNTSNLVNRTFKFNIKLEGDTLTLIGVGNPWKEVWKRVKSDSVKPPKTESIPQGKWLGKEVGRGAGTVSLVFQGAN